MVSTAFNTVSESFLLDLRRQGIALVLRRDPRPAAYASALSPSFLDKKTRVTKSVNGLCAATTVALESSLSITCATLNTGWMQRLRTHLVLAGEAERARSGGSPLGDDKK